VLRELERCRWVVVDLCEALCLVVWPLPLVEVLALLEVMAGRPKARPAAAMMLAAVAEAATVLTRVRPRSRPKARATSSRLLSVMA